MKLKPTTQEEIYRMRFEEIYTQFTDRRLTCEESAEILGICERTFLRKRRRFECKEFDGRFDLRLGKPSPHRAADREVERTTRLYNERYRGFSVQHFYEFACRDHALSRSYSWTKNTLRHAGLIQKSTRGGKHRIRRERRPMSGMMIHQDGSTHQWIPSLDYNFDLIVTMDDATSEITSAFFIEEEGTISTFRGVRETIEKYGLFCSFYTDRGSHYFYTPEAGGKVDKTVLTQVGRALKQLRIKHISAYSPQARGRSERMFGTLQNRLPKEFSLKGIKTMEEANTYLKNVYIPRHNEQFTVKAKEEKNAFTPWIGAGLKDILCLQEERIVQNDNTVRYNGYTLQIPKNDCRHHYVRTTVNVHTYEDGSIALFYGHMCLGQYDMKGNLLKENEIMCQAA